MSCVEIIKNNIAQVNRESEAKKQSMEQSINDYLDAVNEFKRDCDSFRKDVDDLSDLILNSFDGISEHEFLQFKEDLSKLITSLNSLYAFYHNSPFHSGFKTSIRELYYSINNLIEIYEDLKIFKIRLPKNNTFSDISKSLNSF